MPITNEDLMKELKEIKKILKDNFSKEEKLLEKEEEILEKEEEKLEVLTGAGKKKKYDTTVAWEAKIWKECPEKDRQVTKDSIFYNCKLTGKACSFDNCPKNIV